MNKAMMFLIHKKWVDMIFDGTKKYEFRNKLPKDLVKGMKIYFYETLGKMKQGITPVSEINPMPRYWCSYEGLGMIVGEATVGRRIKVINFVDGKWQEPKIDMVSLNGVVYKKSKLEEIGYDYQQYAIELTNVIKYEKFEEQPNFGKVIWSTLCSANKIKGHDYCDGCSYYIDCSNETTYCMDCLRPSAPIPKEKFVSWNKFNKYKKDNPKMEFDYVNNQLYYTWKPEFDGDYNDMFSTNKCNVTHAPQAPIYVVEKEETK